MSTSVMSLPYTDKSGGITSAGSSPPSPVTAPDTGTLLLPPSSLKHSSGHRPRLLGMPGSGLKISFASDTSFAERKLRTRGSPKGDASSLNLRPLEVGEKPSTVRIKLPKATNAMGPHQVPLLASPLQEELMHPRRALDIARSYGVPKYFLRGNSQILTDRRMRLFTDTVWKKERMSPQLDGGHLNGRSTENSDVICRLMDSVDKAIATSERPQQDLSAALGLGSQDGTVRELKVENSRGAVAERERTALRDRFVSLPDVLTKVSVKEAKQEVAGEAKLRESSEFGGRADTECEKDGEDISKSTLPAKDNISGDIIAETQGLSNAVRPHTVDTTPNTGYLPQVTHFRDKADPSFDIQRAMAVREINDLNEHSPNRAQQRQEIGITRGVNSLSSQAAGLRLHQLNSGSLRGISESFSPSFNKNHSTSNNTNSINNRVGVLFGGKYRNVLPRFYPAVSAHHVRQREAALRMGSEGVRLTTTAGGQKCMLIRESPHHHPRRLVRFSDTTHTVRFSKEASVVPSSGAVFASSKSNRLGRDPMAGSGVLVASRAPVQSVQRSLDSHSGLSRQDWSRGGRMPKYLTTTTATTGRRSLFSTAANTITNSGDPVVGDAELVPGSQPVAAKTVILMEQTTPAASFVRSDE